MTMTAVPLAGCWLTGGRGSSSHRPPAALLLLLAGLGVAMSNVPVAAQASAKPAALPAGGSNATPRSSSAAASPGGPSPAGASPAWSSGSPELTLTAYDCAHPDAEQDALDLGTLPKCEQPVEPVRRPVEIRLLDVRALSALHVYTCRVQVITHITAALKPGEVPPEEQYYEEDYDSAYYDGASNPNEVASQEDSHRSVEYDAAEPSCNMTVGSVVSSLSSATTQYYTHPVTRDACKQMHRRMPYIYHDPILRHNISIVTEANSTSWKSSYPTDCPTCMPEYVFHHKLYKGVCVSKTVEVTLQDFWVSVNRSGPVQAVSMAMPAGYSCRYEERYCVSAVGVAYWDLVPEDQCGDEHNLDVIYEGAAVVITHRPYETTTHVEFTYPDPDRGNRSVAFQLRSRTQVCKDRAFTIAPGGRRPFRYTGMNMFVALKPPGQNFSFMPSSLPTVHSSEYGEAQSQRNILFGELNQRDLKSRTKAHLDRFSLVHSECLRRRRQQRVRLAAVRASADPVAALEGELLEDIEGVRGEVVGGVLRLTQCVPVAVRLRNASRCYQEVPVVTAAGVQAFMTSPRRFLQSAGSEVPCHPQPLHRLDGQWVAFGPEPRLVSAALPAAMGPVAQPRD